MHGLTLSLQLFPISCHLFKIADNILVYISNVLDNSVFIFYFCVLYFICDMS